MKSDIIMRNSHLCVITNCGYNSFTAFTPIDNVRWYCINYCRFLSYGTCTITGTKTHSPCWKPWSSPAWPPLPWPCPTRSAVSSSYTLAANDMESLLLNGICVNLIGIYCFWSYVQLRNEIQLISSIHYLTKLNGQTQRVLSWDRWDSREGKKWVQG